MEKTFPSGSLDAPPAARAIRPIRSEAEGQLRDRKGHPMSIIKTYTSWDFINDFQNNFERRNQFSLTALYWLFDWYDEFGHDWEMDVTEVCCDWTEYDSPSKVWEAYGHLVGCPEDPERFAELLERIGDETNYAILENCNCLIQNF